MAERPTLDTELYATSGGEPVCMRDLLEYFSARGTMRVSDLHLKVGSAPVYRVDGSLQKMNGPPLDRATVEAMASTLISDDEQAELAKDRSIDSSYLTESLQFRLNCFYDNDGMVIAIRALDPEPMDVEKIGFPNQVWQDIVNQQWGLVLITGITGAGKSTTIASMIDRITATRAVRVITLEDPIEYRLSSRKGIVSQREVGRDVPGFARGLRDCLREDPDVIFVGEMRDRESAAWTLTAAETGHLVFSTLHTRDARGSITRLLDMFPADQQDEIANQLSLGLSHIICQKLLPRADGQGRVAAMEILTNSYALANLIRTRKVEQIYSMLQTRTKDVPEERMVTLERSLVRLVQSKIITPLEAEKWANHRAVFLGEMQHLHGKVEE